MISLVPHLNTVFKSGRFHREPKFLSIEEIGTSTASQVKLAVFVATQKTCYAPANPRRVPAQQTPRQSPISCVVSVLEVTALFAILIVYEFICTPPESTGSGFWSDRPVLTP